MAGPKLKFPRPIDYAPKLQAIMCPADRVLRLYNQDSGKGAKRIAKKVRVWFASKATHNGWAGVRFLKQVPDTHGAGCVLWRPPTEIELKIQVTQEVLVLQAQADGGKK